MRVMHVISVSGGKDSAATLLLAIARFGREYVIAIFCDTGNEHQVVYEYLDYLELALGIKITRLKANFDNEIANKRRFIARDQRTGRRHGRKLRWTNKAKRRALAVLQPTGNPFLDLCLWKGRFPSRKAQFCTEQLKRNPAVEFQMDLIDQGYKVVSWQGVRRDESLNRRRAKRFEDVGGGLYIYRPIVDWSARDVFDYCARHGIKPNPLYMQGMGRVGCMPCINARKNELREIGARFPEHVARIHEWEQLVGAASKRQASTFIPAPGITPVQAKEHGIYSIIEWSRTSRGGRQYDMLADLIDSDSCASSYGLCDSTSWEEVTA
ncbi:phosphoadenosine phosphosulfate reductase family protein [Paenalcaligenes niemegkensis]|uniref:phosphoadenosine phosphosulfate reductase domain-containing protein n=1 Tax=Paenalcaligenes niemegkensis TaxID=2895469 RepID=UPI001EE8FD0A|nr:phosphoadenosine phosphosulfate reductase family protein [Paenalcaligenes niemegkensis]MCQ9618372.1 phosphoadenosine phosphosulfate reductase family protein [Paenalcaligenes niemegkensis]